jgi:WD40 repeat protein
VTRIAFSPDDTLVLTVSRDRGWHLFERGPNTGAGYEITASEERAHARMVLDCAWAPSGAHFATASRDKTVKIWTREGGAATAWKVTHTIPLTEAATAVAVTEADGADLVAVGTESGAVSVYVLNAEAETRKIVSIPAAQQHAAAVNRLEWAPNADKGLHLASAGEDRAVRIFDIRL